MGKATIVSGGEDGQYRVKLDFGKAQKDAAIARINARLPKLAAEIVDATTELSAQQAIEDAQKVMVYQAIEAFVAASMAIPRNEADVAKALQDHGKEAAKLMEEKGKTGPLRLALEILKDEQAGLQRELDRWLAIVVEEERDAWCADFTEDATGSVATIDVPGESAQILIAPSAPEPTASDGQLVAREVQTPAQVFWNAAALPGWQKYMPTFRVGVITVMNTDETANVTLDEAKSSAQNLDINKVTELESVEIKYMECDATVFEVGDHVVVQFEDQDWDKPKIVGFASNPKSCGGGFIFRPTNNVNTVYELASYAYWGKPFTEGGGEPLGTVKGAAPFVALQPKKGAGGALLDEYKRVRGIDGSKYGQVDWQGVALNKGVLSWSARSWDRLTFKSDGTPEYRWNQWEGGDVTDSEKSVMMVQRCRNIGTGNAVYAKLRAVKVFSGGVVEGACFSTVWGARAMVAVLRSSGGAGSDFTFVKVGSPDVVIGIYTVPANTVNLHGWYFNKSGTKARCTFASKTDQFAVEATLSSMGGVAFADVPNSRTSSDPDAYFLSASAPWNPPLSYQALSAASSASITVSGSMMETSPAFYADFYGDFGLIAVMRRTVEKAPAFDATFDITNQGTGAVSASFALNMNGPGVMTTVHLLADDGSDMSSDDIDFTYGSASEMSLSQTYATSSLGNGNYSTTIAEQAETFPPSGNTGTVGAVLDVDARALAVLIRNYQVVTEPWSYSRSVTTEPFDVSGSEVFESISMVDVTTEKVSTKSASGNASSDVSSVDASKTAVSYTGPADGTSGAPPFTAYSPMTGLQTGVPYSVSMYERSLSAWQSYTNNGGSSDMVYGMVRSLGGKVCSSTLVWVGGYYQSLGSSDPAEKGVAHVIPPVSGANDATVLAGIQAQATPWLAKLGVY